MSRGARARGRLAVGGRAQLRVPWPIGSIDPHRLDDATASIFGGALFDSLYAIDGQGGVVASLAETDPEPSAGEHVVRLRAGLVTALGRPLGSRDVISSIARARGAGASAWLADVPTPRRVDDLTVTFAARDPKKLAATLASPLVAIVPSTFTASSPDGTGPFRCNKSGASWSLVRNVRAARGPSLLDEVNVSAAGDLAASLRSFEAGTDDVGWLGMGLHEPRPFARAFDAGAVAFAVLRTGSQAGVWDAPGTAQRLCDGIAPSKLGYLALGSPWPADKEEGWGGAPCEILVRDDCPWLVELARAVAATLSRSGHEVTAKEIAASDFSTRRSTRAYALAIDVVRPLGPGTLGALAALATASDATAAIDVIRKPPRLGDVPARTLTRTLKVGIVGEVRAQGGRVPDLTLAAGSDGIDWGSSTREKTRG